MTISNFFEELKEVLDDENNNIREEKAVKPLPIFVDKNSNFTSLSQLRRLLRISMK